MKPGHGFATRWQSRAHVSASGVDLGPEIIGGFPVIGARRGRAVDVHAAKAAGAIRSEIYLAINILCEVKFFRCGIDVRALVHCIPPAASAVGFHAVNV